LDDSGQMGNTLVVFTSDHGIPFPRAKCTLFDPGLEVPLIMAGPMLEALEKRNYHGLTSMIDLLPTVCDLLGLAIPSSVQGVSHAQVLEQSTSVPVRDELYAQMTYHDYYDPLRCIRTDRYKLIVSFEATRAWMDPTQQWDHQSSVHLTLEKAGLRHPPLRLYDLESDPLEQNNLADDASYATVRHELGSKLLEMMRQTDDPVLFGMPVSPAHREAVSLLTQTSDDTAAMREKSKIVEVLP